MHRRSNVGMLCEHTPFLQTQDVVAVSKVDVGLSIRDRASPAVSV